MGVLTNSLKYVKSLKSFYYHKILIEVTKKKYLIFAKMGCSLLYYVKILKISPIMENYENQYELNKKGQIYL